MEQMVSLPPPVVFLGPSCPEDDVRAILPDATVLPPVQRGDLYRHRILKSRLFVIIDGVFANEPAVSPREVVDVIEDGAMIVGASSMGALRAADCAPAGAIGIGQIFRLFRRGSISSEDEVAVLFSSDRPFPPLSEPLVNMRMALRRATRAKMLTGDQSRHLMTAAHATHYAERTWRGVFAKANLALSEDLAAFLSKIDAKREDARAAFRWVARRLSHDRKPLGSPRTGSHVFGLLHDGRERSPDPLDGSNAKGILTDLFTWLMASGQIYNLETVDPARLLKILPLEDVPEGPLLAGCLEDASSSAEFDAVRMRFSVFQRAHNHARHLDLRPRQNDLCVAQTEIAHAHGKISWNDLINSYGQHEVFYQLLEEYRFNLALTKCLKTLLFHTKEPKARESVESYVWRR